MYPLKLDYHHQILERLLTLHLNEALVGGKREKCTCSAIVRFDLSHSHSIYSRNQSQLGQDAHRRIRTAIGLAVVGLNWQDVEKKSGFAMLCDKNENRGILTGLEGVTGNKAVDTDALTVKN